MVLIGVFVIAGGIQEFRAKFALDSDFGRSLSLLTTMFVGGICCLKIRKKEKLK
jgi:hypothetical protein